MTVDAGYDGPKDFPLQEAFRLGGQRVGVDDREIGSEARHESAAPVLGVGREGRRRGEERDRLHTIETLRRVPTIGRDSSRLLPG